MRATRRRTAFLTSTGVLALLHRFESRNVTFTEPDGSWPIVWERAQGVHVWDADGRKYLDLTAAFGVAAAGHANPRVVKAGQQQMDRLAHAMGDVHPHAVKARLARDLSGITFERWHRGTSGKTIFCNSGFEAVEAALKTALLATNRPGVMAFEGGYHGLGYGALTTTHRAHFRSPFRPQLARFATFVPFPNDAGQLAGVEQALRRAAQLRRPGAVLVEPVQGRGGLRLPPREFLPMLRRFCNQHGALLICDEVYTGFGRTGTWFACEHNRVVPDVICLGKALTGGFPLSACVGRADVMDRAWPPAIGEAIHTSTYLGHPVGCAMALAQMAEIRKRGLVRRSARLGSRLVRELKSMRPGAGLHAEARGLGLMAGIELRLSDGAPATQAAWSVIKGMLRRGFVLLPEGEHGNVISFTPPLTITEPQLRRALAALGETLAEL